MKKYCYYCPKCKKVTLMTLVKEDSNTNTIFLKCMACSNPETTTADMPTKKGKKAVKEKSHIKEYSPKESYKVGDILYHKVFNDTGEVIKITKKLNGQNINTVMFLTSGMKKLITVTNK